jgi:hypothetical protein
MQVVAATRDVAQTPGMEWKEFCEDRAQDCEARADEMSGQDRAEWLLMALDWRAAGAANDNQPREDEGCG